MTLTRTTCPYCGVGCGVLAGADGTIKGDTAGAAACFRRYMEIEPSGYWSAKAKQALDRLEGR